MPHLIRKGRLNLESTDWVKTGEYLNKLNKPHVGGLVLFWCIRLCSASK